MAGAMPLTIASRPRFWKLYASAWLVFFGLQTLVYLSSGMMSFGASAMTAFLTILPESVAGLAVIALCRHIEWPGAPRPGFVAAHLGGAFVFGVVCAASMNVLFALHRWLTQGMFRPYYFEAGTLSWQIFFASLVYAVIASTAYSVELMERVREEEARVARAQELQARAELRALRARLNPHFLFNTLHSLLALVRSDPNAAEEALEQFGELLHYVLRIERDDREEVSLRSEWEFASNYLALERLRLGERLRVDARIAPEALASKVPAFSIQSLVENAVRHGIAPRAGGGILSVVAEPSGDTLLVSVVNESVEPRLPVPPRGPSEGGVGLSLLRDRLLAAYGEIARLEVDAGSDARFRVSFRVPLGDDVDGADRDDGEEGGLS
jgi:two-component system, LytTR family, sensor kinase